MVTAAIIGTALGGGVAGPTRSLFLDGLDVRLEPGTGTRYGVPLDTIQVTEQGPDGISAITFTIEDPGSEVTVTNGMAIYYVDHVSGIPEFRGWVQTWTESVFGVGRQWQITGIGVEALLDWMVIPADVTFAAGAQTYACVQTLASQALTAGASLNIANTGNSSTQAGPVSKLVNGISNPNVLDIAVTVTAGTTLREGIRQLSDATSGGSFAISNLRPRATVDYWFGLRYWGQSSGVTDYLDVTVNDVPAGPIIAADLQHEADAGGVVRGVYVKGGNAAGSGVVMDGSGLPGQISTLDDATILTSAARDQAGYAYLVDKAQSVRGSFRRETFTDTSTLASHVQAGAYALITDAQLGLTGTPFSAWPIAQITKTYHGGGLETWTISYGGLPPSLSRALRRLTRTVRN